jgi:hypothetical protein
MLPRLPAILVLALSSLVPTLSHAAPESHPARRQPPAAKPALPKHASATAKQVAPPAPAKPVTAAASKPVSISISMEAPAKPAPVATPARPRRTARIAKPVEARRPLCTKPAVVVTTGTDSATFPLTKCDGTPAPSAVDELSILARPPSTPKPKAPTDAKNGSPDVAPGIKRLDPRLVERLDLAAEHFRRNGSDPARVLLVSGYRPQSARSYHQLGRALDFRIEGVTNEALVAFCKTLPDTGCGYYPNSLFVHMDVRDAGAGHVTWIDVSHPGEAPKYVSQWPLPGANASSSALPLLPPAGEQPEMPGHARTGAAHPYFF